MPGPSKKKAAVPSFLAFVCHEELGPNVTGSSWHCPKCDPGPEEEWKSFTVRPALGNFPIKFRCHRCSWWGDEHDLLRFIYPGEENRDVRRLRLAELKRMYLRDYSSPLGEIAKMLAAYVRSRPAIVRPTGKTGKKK